MKSEPMTTVNRACCDPGDERLIGHSPEIMEERAMDDKSGTSKMSKIDFIIPC